MGGGELGFLERLEDDFVRAIRVMTNGGKSVAYAFHCTRSPALYQRSLGDFEMALEN